MASLEEQARPARPSESVFDGMAQTFPLKGLAVVGASAWDNTAAYQSAIDDQSSRLTWFYDYAQTASGVIPPGVQYVPTIPRLAQVTAPNIAAAVASAGPNGYMLVGNEPDQVGEDVFLWIAAWETIATDPGVVANNIKLISPSCGKTDGPNGTSAWFATFMAGITHQPYALSLHPYSSSTDPTVAIGQFVSGINKYHQTYPAFPSWVTEFGSLVVLTDDQAFEQLQNDMQSIRVVQRGVQRIAYFFIGPEGYSGAVTIANSGLYNSNGTARPLAAKWKSFNP